MTINDDATTAVDGMVARQTWTPADTAGRQYVWPVERDTDDQDWRWDGEAMYATRELAVLAIKLLESEQQAAVDRWFASTFQSAYTRWTRERAEHLVLAAEGLRTGAFAKPAPRDERRYVPAHLRQRWRVGEPVLVVHP